MSAYQRGLFDTSLTLVPRYLVGRTIRVTNADWQQDHGKEGIIEELAVDTEVVYIADVDGLLEVFYEREITIA